MPTITRIFGGNHNPANIYHNTHKYADKYNLTD